MADEETRSDMTAYQKMEQAKLDDIGHDTDALIKMLGDEKMGESFDSGMLAGLMSQKGVDPGIVAMLNQGAHDGTLGSNGGLLVLLFLIILLGGGNGLWGRGNGGIDGVDRTVINEANQNALLQAITQSGQAQTSAVQTLASNLNTDVANITSALASVDKQIAINQGSITSAIQACCCNIRTELQKTANDTQMALLNGFNGLQNQASQIAFAQQQGANQNTQSILSAINAQTALIHDGFCDIRTRELEAEVSRLRDLNAQQRDAANTQLVLTAIANKDTLNYSGTISGTTFAGTGSLS